MLNKFFGDSFYSLFSKVLPIFVLQYVLHPLIADKLSGDQYGKLLTIVALINLSGVTIGSALNNSRLVLAKELADSLKKGDYNFLLLIGFIIQILYIIIVFYELHVFNAFSVIILLLYSVFLILKGYISVELRFNLVFSKLFVDSVLLTLGYAIGYVLFLFYGYWELIYFVGTLFSCIYLIRNTTILNEPIVRSKSFSFIAFQSSSLLFATLLISIGTYMDRLIIYPILGPEMVTVFYVSGLLGKSLGLIIGPLSGLLLSYFARMEAISHKQYNSLLLVTLAISIVSYLMVIYFDEYILTFLYPKYAISSLEYTPIITMGVLLIMTAGVMNTVLMRFVDLKWQIINNLIFISIYIIFSLVLIRSHGLLGFAWATVLSGLVKLSLVYIVWNYKGKYS
jgi:O-antigen/teichoic acid export membrane protein